MKQQNDTPQTVGIVAFYDYNIGLTKRTGPTLAARKRRLTAVMHISARR